MAKIGIIGTGWGARVQVPAFRRAGLDVVGISGKTSEKTRKIASELEVSRAYDDWRELVSDEAIDLVSIVTPPSTHMEIALASLRAGKHVLSEKPTAMNSEEAEAMLGEAESRPGQISLIDHELRFLPAWAAAREKLGSIGTLRHAEVRYSSPSRGATDRPWNWWSDEAQGGGILGAVGSHAVDALRHLCGEIDAVQALLGTFVATRPWEGSDRAVTSDDFASFHVRFSNGALGVITLSAVASVDEPTTITLHGENGGLRLRDGALFSAMSGGSWETVLEEDIASMGDSPGGAFGTATVYLGRAIRTALDDGDRSALKHGATFADGLRQQQVLDAARRSHRIGGEWVTVGSVQDPRQTAPAGF